MNIESDEYFGTLFKVIPDQLFVKDKTARINFPPFYWAVCCYRKTKKINVCIVFKREERWNDKRRWN